MATSMPVSTAAKGLEDLLAQLPLGETVSLLDDDGTPVALLVSLRQTLPLGRQSALEGPPQSQEPGPPQSRT
jgi:hypothetical protein